MIEEYVREHIDHEKRSFHFTVGLTTVVGGVVACEKCGRLLLVEASCWEPRTLPTPAGRCLECIELSEGFRRQCPGVAAAIDGWKAEGDPRP